MTTARGKVREALLTLSTADAAALVRCEAGKPFADQRTVKKLHKLGLVQKTSWSLTSLGEEVVGKLVGIPVRESTPVRPTAVRTAPNSIPHGPLRMPRVATPGSELERFAEWLLREHNVIHRREPLLVSGFSNETYRDPDELLEAYRDASSAEEETAEEKAPKGKFKVPEGCVAAEARALRDTACTYCNGTVKKDAECIWVEGRGIYHPECLELSEVS